MTEQTDEGTLAERLQAVKRFAEDIDRFVVIGSLRWDLHHPNFLGLAVNNCLRRQREAIDGAIALAQAEQGHLAVAFVRAALEERLWLEYLGGLNADTANRLILVMACWDGVRSLVAQRDYIGDEVMTQSLWYPPGYVEAQASQLDSIREALKDLRSELGWSNGLLPSMGWIAAQVDQTPLSEYLHSATSRAIHFSAGEILRRGWGTPGGLLVTDKTEFRAHLANFALDTMWRLFLETALISLDFLEGSGVTVTDAFRTPDTRHLLSDDLLALGCVPLVHASEWNLTPEGPLPRLSEPESDTAGGECG